MIDIILKIFIITVITVFYGHKISGIVLNESYKKKYIIKFSVIHSFFTVFVLINSIIFFFFNLTLNTALLSIISFVICCFWLLYLFIEEI